MKKLILALFCSSFSFFAFAQLPVKNITIKGIVIDSAINKPMSFVTVALQNAVTKQAVKSNLTKEDGSFELKAPAGNLYQLVFAFIGYKSKVVNITDTALKVDVGSVLLSSSVNQLKEVSVTAVKPLMKREVDRISYDVQADPESKAITALDMMRKVPLLTVDGSDNIQLKGSGNYKILINGKESALMAKSPSDVLKAMPATNIQKIEVITTPPAKYDAEGLAGIINIVTKTNGLQGYNGGLNSRLNSVYGLGVNVNGTVKEGKFGLAGFAGYGHQKQQGFTDNNQTFFARQSLLSQSSASLNHGNSKYADAELSYEIDTLNLLTGAFEVFHSDFNNGSDQLSNQLNSNGLVTQAYQLNNQNRTAFQGMDIGINYQLGFKRNKEQLLTMSYKYGNSPNSQYSDIAILNPVNYPQPNYNQSNNSGSKEHTVQLDYVHPLKSISVEAGVKAIMRNNYSDFEVNTFDKTSGLFLPDATQTNQFNYHQDVYSVYNSYQVKADQWTAKAGVRLEHTLIDANFTSAGSAVNQNYNNFIPSISVQRSFKSSSINLGFTERIQRPGIYQLNPFVDRSNPNFISTGNPALHPELNHAFELTYSNYKKSAVTVGLSYSFSNNSIQNVTNITTQTVNAKTDTITTTTFRNLGSNSSLGFNINTNYAVTKHINLSINGQLSRLALKGTYNGQFYQNSGYTGNIFANAAYKFKGGYRFGVDAGYFSGDVTLQGKSGNFIYSSNVFSKEFTKAKATISLVANNPYGKFWSSKSTTTTPDFYQAAIEQSTYRTFAIRLNYRFGKLNSEIKRNQRGINNDDTKGGAKTTSS